MPNPNEILAPPDNKPNLFEWLRGKRMSNITLPPESGQVDPTLPTQSPSLQGILEAAKNYKKLQENAILGPALGR